MASKEIIEKKVPAWKKAAATGLAVAALTSVAGCSNPFEDKSCKVEVTGHIDQTPAAEFACPAGVKLEDIKLDTSEPSASSGYVSTIVVENADKTVSSVLFPQYNDKSLNINADRIVEKGSPEYVKLIIDLPPDSFDDLSLDTKAAVATLFIDDLLSNDSHRTAYGDGLSSVSQDAGQYYDVGAYQRVTRDFKNSSPEDVVQAYFAVKAAIAVSDTNSTVKRNINSALLEYTDPDREPFPDTRSKIAKVELVSQDTDLKLPPRGEQNSHLTAKDIAVTYVDGTVETYEFIQVKSTLEGRTPFDATLIKTVG